jgi:hypothetical protein
MLPQAWRDQIRWGVLDLSGPYRKTVDDGLPDVMQVADPFHLVKLANQKLDEAAGGWRTTPSAIGAARPTRCIEPEDC